MELNYKNLDEFIFANAGKELKIFLLLFEKNINFHSTSNTLNKLRKVKLFLSEPSVKIYMIDLFKKTILHGRDCLTLSLLTRYLMLKHYNIDIFCCKPTAFFKRYHVSVVYYDENNSLKLFKIAGRDYIFDYVILDEKSIIKNLHLTKPFLHFVNTKILKKY